jgi:hypothetical protein
VTFPSINLRGFLPYFSSVPHVIEWCIEAGVYHNLSQIPRTNNISWDVSFMPYATILLIDIKILSILTEYTRYIKTKYYLFRDIGTQLTFMYLPNARNFVAVTKLTNFMELSPSWEVASCAVTQELPSILWNPEVHHRVHISPPPVPVLSQIDPVRSTPSYLSKINF